MWDCVWTMAGLSSLTWPCLTGVSGWVLLPTRQVQPAITTHIQEIYCMAAEHPCHVQYQTIVMNSIFNTTTLRPLSGEAQNKSPRWSVVLTFATTTIVHS